jgi:hypothetical protein
MISVQKYLLEIIKKLLDNPGFMCYIIGVRKNNNTPHKRKEVITMSKIHATMKYVKSLWKNIYRCGYCDLQYIMRYEEPMYYNSGVYGWNCDIYCDYRRDIAITTGYRNMAGKRIPDELIEKYTNIAKEICKNEWNKPHEEILAELNENRNNFFDELWNI